MVIRGLLICLLFGCVLKFQRKPVFTRMAVQRWSLIRAFLELLATLTFLTGLSLLPLATNVTLAFASPMILAVLAAIILSERVSSVRWMVIGCGFIGVMLITEPFQATMNWAVLLPLACAFFVALRDIATRYIPAKIPSLQLAFTNAWVVMLGGGCLSIFQGWETIPPEWYFWFIGLAIAMSVGYTCYIMGTRTGDLSFIAPFKYSSIILAIIIGYLVWGDVPNLSMIIGSSIIIVSGIFLLGHEKRKKPV